MYMQMYIYIYKYVCVQHGRGNFTQVLNLKLTLIRDDSSCYHTHMSYIHICLYI